eukprot:ANDGO_01094.mRNA.1 Dynein regulatory complex subunit 3
MCAGDVRSLDLSGNDLMEVSGLTPFIALSVINLSRNRISHLRGLPMTLTKIDVSHNHLDYISGLEALSNLQEIDLSSNRIKNMIGLSRNLKLRILKLGHNFIETIEGIEHLTNLESLDLENNSIQKAEDIRSLSVLTKLKILRLCDNPVSIPSAYKVTVLHLLPNLVRLDGVNAPSYLRTAAGTSNQKPSLNEQHHQHQPPVASRAGTMTPECWKSGLRVDVSAPSSAAMAVSTPSSSASTPASASSTAADANWKSGTVKRPQSAQRSQRTKSASLDASSASLAGFFASREREAGSAKSASKHSAQSTPTSASTKPRFTFGGAVTDGLSYHNIKERNDQFARTVSLEKQELTEKIEKLTASLKESEKKYAGVERRLLDVQKELDQARTSSQVDQFELRAKEAEEALRQAQVKYESEIRSLQSLVKGERKKVRTLEEGNQKLHMQLDDAIASNTELRYQRAKASEDAENARKEIVKLKKTFETGVSLLQGHQKNRQQVRGDGRASTVSGFSGVDSSEADVEVPSQGLVDWKDHLENELDLSALNFSAAPSKAKSDDAEKPLGQTHLRSSKRSESSQGAAPPLLLSAGNASPTDKGRNFNEYAHLAGPAANNSQFLWESSLRGGGSSHQKQDLAMETDKRKQRHPPLPTASNEADSRRLHRKKDEEVSSRSSEPSNSQEARLAHRPSSRSSSWSQDAPQSSANYAPPSDISKNHQLASTPDEGLDSSFQMNEKLSEMDSDTRVALENLEFQNQALARRIRNVLLEMDKSDVHDSPRKWERYESHLRARMSSPTFPKIPRNLPDSEQHSAARESDDVGQNIIDSVIRGETLCVSQSTERTLEFAFNLKRWLMLELDKTSDQLNRKRALEAAADRAAVNRMPAAFDISSSLFSRPLEVSDIRESSTNTEGGMPVLRTMQFLSPDVTPSAKDERERLIRLDYQARLDEARREKGLL